MPRFRVAGSVVSSRSRMTDRDVTRLSRRNYSSCRYVLACGVPSQTETYTYSCSPFFLGKGAERAKGRERAGRREAECSRSERRSALVRWSACRLALIRNRRQNRADDSTARGTRNGWFSRGLGPHGAQRQTEKDRERERERTGQPGRGPMRPRRCYLGPVGGICRYVYNAIGPLGLLQP
jgi:hypothetical protein